MDEILQQLEKAVQRKDLDRLHRLHRALTDLRPTSYYAHWPDEEAARVAEIVEAAIARLAPKPRAKRARKPRPAPVLDTRLLHQADLFEDLSRWPRRPYCSEDLEAGLRIRSLAHALSRPYIQANPPHLRVWSIHDIDRPGAASAWMDADLPPPTWSAINRLNGHAHSVWGLSVPVLVDGLGARSSPMRYLCAVESYMRERLEADGGYSGLITKNPEHPLWDTLRGPRMAYTLTELAECLPGLEKYKPKRRVPEEVGLGRNVCLFDKLRVWAYKAIRPHWQAGGLGGWNAWLSECNTRALVYNADFRDPLGGREVWHIARSVAKWTWRNFSAADFSAWQANAGHKGGIASGLARRAASEDKRASARLMAAAGRSMTAIAAELGVTRQAVAKWLRDPRN